MPRLLFEKKGNAVWISHLDLMRVFQRAFKRAGLPLTHTQGFNPRPSVSIALPLSVGIESTCELLDFDLDAGQIPCEKIADRLNQVLIDGIHVLDVYNDAAKIKNIAFLDCKINMEYDNGIAAHVQQDIMQLFAQSELLVTKKNKNGETEQNIIPMIKSFRLEQTNEHVLTAYARICCQNPTLNPMQISAAIEKYLPECKPDFVTFSREEVYDTNENIFR